MEYYEIKMMDGETVKTQDPPSAWKDNRLCNGTDLIFWGVEVVDLEGVTVILNTDLIVYVRHLSDKLQEEIQRKRMEEMTRDTVELTNNVVDCVLGGLFGFPKEKVIELPKEGEE